MSVRILSLIRTLWLFKPNGVKDMDTEWGKLLVAKKDISAGLHQVVCRELEQ
jgi:hypothetical protein